MKSAALCRVSWSWHRCVIRERLRFSMALCVAARRGARRRTGPDGCHRHPELPIRSPEQLSDDDWRKTNPRFTGGNFKRNLRIVDEVQAVASEWVRHRRKSLWPGARAGDDIAPIPGTKRVARVEENTPADRVKLSAGQIERLNNLTPAAGECHDEGNLVVIDR